MEEISKKSTKKNLNFVKSMYLVSILYVEISYCAAQTLIFRLNKSVLPLSRSYFSGNASKYWKIADLTAIFLC